MKCVSDKSLFWMILRQSSMVLAMLAGLGGPSVRAGRIPHVSVLKPPPATRLSFARFLEAGPGLWSHATPRVPRGLALRTTADGTLGSGPLLDYLLYRRSLGPSRFDAHHPHIGPVLAAYLPPLPVVSVPMPAPQTVAPTHLTPPAIQQVPEPSSLVIGGVLLAGAIFVKRQRARGVA